MRLEILDRLDASGEESAADRRIGYEADAQLAHGGEDLLLRPARPERILGLQRGDAMHGVRAADGPRRRLGEPDVPHLAGAHQLGHGADGLFDRRARVDAVLVVEIDGIDAQALQRGVAGGANVFRTSIDADPAPVGIALVAELGRQDDLVAAAADGAADQPLVGERAVHVGGVEKVDAEVERAVDGGDRLRVVVRAVELGHAHAAQADRSDFEGA